MDLLAPTGAALVIIAVLLYGLYVANVIRRPALAQALVPFLGSPRRVVLISGVLLALLGVIQAPEGLSLVAGVAAALGMRHAVRRQWAFGLRPTRARSWPDPIADDVVLAVLPDGRAAPIAWLEHARLVTTDGAILVACSLARSLAAFTPPASPTLVLRPLAVGFAIGSGAVWDGATGAALTAQTPLEGIDIDCVTAGAWRAAFPDAVLLGPPRGALPTVRLERVVRIPGADAAGRMDVVTVGTPRRYLARWAAAISASSSRGSSGAP